MTSTTLDAPLADAPTTTEPAEAKPKTVPKRSPAKKGSSTTKPKAKPAKGKPKAVKANVPGPKAKRDAEFPGSRMPGDPARPHWRRRYTFYSPVSQRYRTTRSPTVAQRHS